MQIPNEPRSGTEVTAEWGTQVSRALRYLRDRPIPRPEERGFQVGEAATSDEETPNSFDVIAEPITPAPASGAQQALQIYAGRLNERLAIIGAQAPLMGSKVPLPMAGLPQDGTWWYVYLKFNDGSTRPQVLSGIQVPFDGTSNSDYLTLAAIRATNLLDAKFDWEVIQLLNGDILRPVLPTFTCSLASENGVKYISMRTGHVTIAVQNWGEPALFSDNAHRLGAFRYTIPGFQNLPANTSASQSLWVAFEYPKGVSGSTLPNAKWGNAQLTPTTLMPTNRPWVVVAEKNSNPDAAQNALGTGSTASTTEVAEADQAAEAGQQRDAAWKDDKLAKEAPPGATHFTDSNSNSSTTGVYDGGVGTTNWSMTEVTTSRTWYKGTTILKTSQATYVSTFTVSGTVATNPTTTSNENPTEVAKLGFGIYTQANPLRWQATVRTAKNKTMAGADAGAGSHTLISAGVVVGYVEFKEITIQRRAYKAQPSGSIDYDNDPPMNTHLDRYYGPGGGYSDDSTSDPKSPNADSPGRGRRAGAGPSSPPQSIAERQGAVNGSGVGITTPGPGLYVFEIARIHPDGRLEQCQSGDIVLHPAPQVCTRTNPKVAALP